MYAFWERSRGEIVIPWTAIVTTGFNWNTLMFGPAPLSTLTLIADKNWYDESLYWRPWITNVLFDDITATLPLNGADIDGDNTNKPFSPILFASSWIAGCDALLNPIICWWYFDVTIPAFMPSPMYSYTHVSQTEDPFKVVTRRVEGASFVFTTWQ